MNLEIDGLHGCAIVHEQLFGYRILFELNKCPVIIQSMPELNEFMLSVSSWDVNPISRDWLRDKEENWLEPWIASWTPNSWFVELGIQDGGASQRLTPVCSNRWRTLRCPDAPTPRPQPCARRPKSAESKASQRRAKKTTRKRPGTAGTGLPNGVPGFRPGNSVVCWHESDLATVRVVSLTSECLVLTNTPGVWIIPPVPFSPRYPGGPYHLLAESCDSVSVASLWTHTRYWSRTSFVNPVWVTKYFNCSPNILQRTTCRRYLLLPRLVNCTAPSLFGEIFFRYLLSLWLCCCIIIVFKFHLYWVHWMSHLATCEYSSPKQNVIYWWSLYVACSLHSFRVRISITSSRLNWNGFIFSNWSSVWSHSIALKWTTFYATNLRLSGFY